MTTQLNKIRATLPSSEVYVLEHFGQSLGAIRLAQRLAQEHCVYQLDPPALDLWQPALHTLELCVGDCEDIAVLKYALLRIAGFPPASLSLVYGRHAGGAHVLLNVALGGEMWAMDVDTLTETADMQPLEVLAYTCGAESAYETCVWSDTAKRQWLGKVRGALGELE